MNVPGMNVSGISDVLTVGIVLTVVFGALFFYLYSRLSQVDQRINLCENILIGLKSETDLMYRNSHELETEETDTQTQQPQPLKDETIEEVDENFYKNVMEQVGNNLHPATTELKETDFNSHSLSTSPEDNNVVHDDTTEKLNININYESLNLKELKALAKQNDVKVPANANKKDIIELLKKSTNGEETLDNNIVE